MSELNFSNYVTLEQVRLLEDDQPDDTLPVNSLSFEVALLQRAQRLVDANQWSKLLATPAVWYRRALIMLLLLFGLLGFFAVLNALGDSGSSQTLNIYWLLLVLLGFNTVSLALWLFGCVGNVGGLIRGSFSSLPIAMQRLLVKFRLGKSKGGSKEQTQNAFNAWYQSNFSEASGVWRLSAVSHAMWLAYLCVGLVTLLAVLSVRQYDFVWGTTLLSADTFVGLTEILAKPLQFVGITTPDAGQVGASRSGLSSAAGADVSRRHWALFLLGSVLVYGIVPRLLAYLVSLGLLRRAQGRFRPDYYLPYYVELRHLLLPESGVAEIVDADDGLVETKLGTAPQFASEDSWSLPNDCCLIGFELSSSVATTVDINVVDRASLAAAELLPAEQSSKALAVVVEVQAAPDRGTQRKLDGLFHLCSQRFLLLHKEVSSEASASSGNTELRLSDWYRLAQSAAVPVENIHVLDSAALNALRQK